VITGSITCYPNLDAGGGALVLASCEQCSYPGEGDHILSGSGALYNVRKAARRVGLFDAFQRVKRDVCRVRV
jgi:hypothetical protein